MRVMMHHKQVRFGLLQVKTNKASSSETVLCPVKVLKRNKTKL